MPDSPKVLAAMGAIMSGAFPEMLISGPRNCGKSFPINHCLFGLHEINPGFQSQVVRLEMKTMDKVYSQLNNKVLYYGLDDKRNPFEFKHSSKSDPRPHILFDNGGKMAFAGMDNSEKALGGEMDLCYYNEVHREHRQSHWSDLLGCMEGGRAGNWGGKSMMLGDANPGPKKHWLLQREKENKLTHYQFRHTDHRLFYSHAAKKWTQQGIDTVRGLKRAYPYGSYEYLRMVLGIWCAATGMVYTQFTEKDNVKSVKRDEISVDAKWSISCDYGRVNAVGVYSRHDGKSILFKEIYRKDESVNVICERINDIKTKYKIDKFKSGVGDHEFNGKQIMKDAGLPIKPANKTVSVKDGIELVRKEFDNNTLIINKHSLEDPDPKLTDGINCSVDELMALRYKEEAKMTGSRTDDLPDQSCKDHAADHIRYHIVDSVKPNYADSYTKGRVIETRIPEAFI